MKKHDQTKAYEESDAQSALRTPRPIPAVGIGRRISAVADHLGTRRNAANIAGVSADALQRYIREENSPPFDALARLCAAAGVRMEWLATGEGPMRLDESAAKPPDASASRQARMDPVKLRAARRAAERHLVKHGKPIQGDDADDLVAALYNIVLTGSAIEDAEAMLDAALRAGRTEGGR